MALGLLLLVSIGKENLYLSGQPEITFFKIAYRRYTNYSIEPTPQYFKTTPDFGRRCTVNISKNADLLGKVYLYVELPTIQLENHSTLPRGLKQFSWVEKIGIALINFTEIEIGGVIVDRHYSDWLNIWHELTNSMGISNGYNKIIGNIPELKKYSNGKSSYVMYIPLTFWFCHDTGLALPLLALMHNDIKIHVEFNDFNKCYKESPTHYIDVLDNYCLFNKNEKIIQTVDGNTNIAEFVYFDVNNQRLYYNNIKGKFSIPLINYDVKYKLNGQTSNYEMNIKSNSFVVEDENYFRFNTPSIISAYLIVNYIYLDNSERINFIKNSHEYLVPTIQTLPEQIMYSTNVNYKLSLVNPVKLLIWRCQIKSNYNSNDIFNYTTYPFTNTQDNLITNHKIIINSVERMSLNNSEHYTLLPKYEYKISSTQNGIYFYSFGINPKEYQPSGSLNFSKIDDAYLQLTLNKLVNYQNPVSVRAFAIQYNLFRASNGIGGLGYEL